MAPDRKDQVDVGDEFGLRFGRCLRLEVGDDGGVHDAGGARIGGCVVGGIEADHPEIGVADP
jgi:hypothetical protein